MSINKAFIKKVLVVKYPIQFWKLMKNREEFVHSHPSIGVFIYSVDRYIDGCRCDEDFNKSQVVAEYDIIKKDLNLIENLRSLFECSEIRFLEEDWN